MTWVAKFGSRKFIMALIGTAFGVAIAFGVATPEEFTQKMGEWQQVIVRIAEIVAGALTALGNVVKYVREEAEIDKVSMEK